MQKTLRIISLLLISFLLSSCASSINHQDNTQAFIQTVAAKDNFDPAQLDQLFSKVYINHAVLKSMKKPKEFHTPWYKYRAIFIQSSRAKQGADFWTAHQTTFTKAQQQYGVPPQIILAILGVETRYGALQGNYKAIDSLATLAFAYPPRETYFQNELEQYLLLTRDLALDPLTLNSSYAGAVGYPQFMPSSYRKYAVSSTNTAADLWNNPNDAILSVANYFHHFNWLPNQPIAIPAIMTGNQYLSFPLNKALKTPFTVKRLANYGIKPAQYLAPNTPVNLIMLDGKQGPEYWITLHNFYVITRYNTSTFYAMAVYQLSQQILSMHQG